MFKNLMRLGYVIATKKLSFFNVNNSTAPGNEFVRLICLEIQKHQKIMRNCVSFKIYITLLEN